HAPAEGLAGEGGRLVAAAGGAGPGPPRRAQLPQLGALPLQRSQLGRPAWNPFGLWGTLPTCPTASGGPFTHAAGAGARRIAASAASHPHAGGEVTLFGGVSVRSGCGGTRSPL